VIFTVHRLLRILRVLHLEVPGRADGPNVNPRVALDADLRMLEPGLAFVPKMPDWDRITNRSKDLTPICTCLLRILVPPLAASFDLDLLRISRAASSAGRSIAPTEVSLGILGV